MQEIPSGSVDLIICDPPYGTIKGIGKSTDKFNKDTTWDVVIPTDRLFDQYERVLRRGGQVVLFSQEPYTHQLRNFVARNMDFCYPMVWYKDSCGNPLLANIAPVSRFEDISVWVKKHDSTNVHPLRDYARELVKYIGKDYKAVAEDFIKAGVPKPTRAQHFLAFDCVQFALCTFETYDLLDRLYGISKWGGIAIFSSWTKSSRLTAKSTAAFSICRTVRPAYPTSWSFAKIRTRFTLPKNPWRLLRTLYASIVTQGIPYWIRVWGALQRRSRLYVPGATG